MTLYEIYQRVCAEIGEIEEATTKTVYKNWINEAQRHIIRAHNWKFLMKRGVVPISAQVTGTGTVATNSNTVSEITGAAALVGYRIVLGSDSNRYFVLSNTGDTVITVDRTMYRTAASGIAYTATKLAYDLTNVRTLENLVSMRYENTQIKLWSSNIQDFEQRFPKDTDTGSPEFFIPIGQANAGTANQCVQGVFYPIPTDSTKAIDYIYKEQLADLASSSDVSSIPINYHDLLVYYTLWKAYQYFNNSDKANDSFSYFNNMLSQLIESDKNSALQWHFFQAATDDDLVRVPRLPDDYADYPYIGGW